MNIWSRKMPDGWMPGRCAICDIPCGQEEHGRQSCPFESGARLAAEEKARKPTAPAGLVERLREWQKERFHYMSENRWSVFNEILREYEGK